MSKQYPFFRDEDEQTQAIIGEEAIASDLNGTYQKPYAVLTQKRLYCKNERGNFIVENGKLLGTGRSKSTSSFTWLLWCAFGIVAFCILRAISGWLPLLSQMSYIDEVSAAPLKTVFQRSMIIWIVALITLAVFFLLQKKNVRLAPILLCLYPAYVLITSMATLSYSLQNAHGIIDLLLAVAPIVLVVVYYIIGKAGNNNFEILHTGGRFAFGTKDYPAGELKQFAEQVRLIQEGVTSGK